MSTTFGSKASRMALAAAIAAICFVPAAQATPVTYNFTATATSGPLNGNVQSGSFTYDSSSIIAGGFNTDFDLLTAFDFTFNGTTYDASTANTGSLGFDSTGNLTSFFISSSCASLGCTFIPGTDNFTILPGPDGLLYSTSTSNDYAFGDVTYSLATGGGVPVPEPGTLGLFGFGVLLLGVVASRRRLALRRSL